MRRWLAALLIGLVIVAPGGARGALDFDGVDDEVSFGDLGWINGAAALTISLWLQLDLVPGTERGWAVKATGVTNTINCRINATPALRCYISTVNGIGGTTLTPGRWYHLAMVYDGGEPTMELYLDGVRESLTVAGGVWPSTLPSTTANYELGNDPGTGGSFVDAKMACHKVWTAALTTSEVTAEAHSCAPRRTQGLRIWTPLDDGVNARDLSGNAHHGVAAGVIQRGSPPVGYAGD